jgi:hypothetical protein
MVDNKMVMAMNRDEVLRRARELLQTHEDNRRALAEREARNREREVEQGLLIRKTREQEFEPPAHTLHSTDVANANDASDATDAELERAQEGIAFLDARIAAAIKAEREVVVTTLGEEIGRSCRDERKRAKSELADEVRTLRIELTEAQTVVAELRRLLAADRCEPLDLPALPRRELN